MRLIDGDELLEFVEDRYEITWESDSYEGGIKDACTDIIEKIETMSTIEPEPKRGKWIVHPEVKNVYGGTYIECSQCGEKYVVQHMEDEKYCRNCGCKMEVSNGSNT